MRLSAIRLRCSLRGLLVSRGFTALRSLRARTVCSFEARESLRAALPSSRRRLPQRLSRLSVLLLRLCGCRGRGFLASCLPAGTLPRLLVFRWRFFFAVQWTLPRRPWSLAVPNSPVRRYFSSSGRKPVSIASPRFGVARLRLPRPRRCWRFVIWVSLVRTDAARAGEAKLGAWNACVSRCGQNASRSRPSRE